MFLDLTFGERPKKPFIIITHNRDEYMLNELLSPTEMASLLASPGFNQSSDIEEYDVMPDNIDVLETAEEELKCSCLDASELSGYHIVG